MQQALKRVIFRWSAMRRESDGEVLSSMRSTGTNYIPALITVADCML